MSNITPPCDYKNQSIAIIGYGVTGKACVNFLLNKGAKVTVFDASFTTASQTTHEQCEGLVFCELHNNVSMRKFALMVVSPGVSLSQAYIQNYIQEKGCKNCVIGDIELFARELNAQNSALSQAHNNAQKPTQLIAVTGSNGKSTVVDMLTKALIKQGLHTVLGGNFGMPALSFISDNGLSEHSKGQQDRPHIDVIVLELSSFQLESTYSLRPDIACILNVTSDHLDRHGNMENYILAKQQIYTNARTIIFNRDDSATFPKQTHNSVSVGITPINDEALNTALSNFYQTQQGIYCGQQLILDAQDFVQVSEFQLVNMQVVLACCQILNMNMNMQMVVESLRQYKGLAHRFQTVEQDATTLWINDSKATNPGACIVALESLSKQVDFIILIAGGDAKGADTELLGQVISKHVNKLVLMGKDAHLFTHFNTPFSYACSMQNAVEIARSFAHEYVDANAHARKNVDAGKSRSSAYVGILLSPACASIDMFTNYQHRGELFCEAVRAAVEV